MKRIGKHMVAAGLSLALWFACTACRTAPHGKPLTEMTEAEQIAYNQHAPMDEPREKGTDFVDVVAMVGAVVIIIPVFLWQSSAWGGAQISTGK
jgi:hypothetical protein